MRYHYFAFWVFDRTGKSRLSCPYVVTLELKTTGNLVWPVLNRWHVCLSNGGSKAVGSPHCADTHHCPSDLPFLFAFLSRTLVCGEEYLCPFKFNSGDVATQWGLITLCIYWLFCVLFWQWWQRFYWFGWNLFFICIWITNHGKLQGIEKLKSLLGSTQRVLAWLWRFCKQFTRR